MARVPMEAAPAAMVAPTLTATVPLIVPLPDSVAFEMTVTELAGSSWPLTWSVPLLVTMVGPV
jgi:hypothetical protein